MDDFVRRSFACILMLAHVTNGDGHVGYRPDTWAPARSPPPGGEAPRAATPGGASEVGAAFGGGQMNSQMNAQRNQLLAAQRERYQYDLMVQAELERQRQLYGAYEQYHTAAKAQGAGPGAQRQQPPPPTTKWPVRKFVTGEQGRTVMAINVGGTTFITSDGIVYAADAYNNKVLPATEASRVNKKIIGIPAHDHSLYNTQRFAKSPQGIYYGMYLPMNLAPGQFTLTLSFAEQHLKQSQKGLRKFDVKINGVVCITNADALATAGRRRVLELKVNFALYRPVQESDTLQVISQRYGPSLVRFNGQISVHIVPSTPDSLPPRLSALRIQHGIPDLIDEHHEKQKQARLKQAAAKQEALQAAKDAHTRRAGPPNGTLRSNVTTAGDPTGNVEQAALEIAPVQNSVLPAVLAFVLATSAFVYSKKVTPGAEDEDGDNNDDRRAAALTAVRQRVDAALTAARRRIDAALTAARRRVDYTSTRDAAASPPPAEHNAAPKSKSATVAGAPKKKKPEADTTEQQTEVVEATAQESSKKKKKKKKKKKSKNKKSTETEEENVGAWVLVGARSSAPQKPPAPAAAAPPSPAAAAPPSPAAAAPPSPAAAAPPSQHDRNLKEPAAPPAPKPSAVEAAPPPPQAAATQKRKSKAQRAETTHTAKPRSPAKTTACSTVATARPASKLEKSSKTKPPRSDSQQKQKKTRPATSSRRSPKPSTTTTRGGDYIPNASARCFSPSIAHQTAAAPARIYSANDVRAAGASSSAERTSPKQKSKSTRQRRKRRQNTDATRDQSVSPSVLAAAASPAETPTTTGKQHISWARAVLADSTPAAGAGTSSIESMANALTYLAKKNDFTVSPRSPAVSSPGTDGGRAQDAEGGTVEAAQPELFRSQNAWVRFNAMCEVNGWEKPDIKPLDPSNMASGKYQFYATLKHEPFQGALVSARHPEANLTEAFESCAVAILEFLEQFQPKGAVPGAVEQRLC